MHVGGVARVLQQRVRGAAVGQRRAFAPGRGQHPHRRNGCGFAICCSSASRGAACTASRRRDVDVTQKSAEPGSEHGGRDACARATARKNARAARRARRRRRRRGGCLFWSSGFQWLRVAANRTPRVTRTLARRSACRRSCHVVRVAVVRPVIRGRLRRAASLARRVVRVRLSRGSVEENAILAFAAVLAAPPLAARRRRQLQRARARSGPARRRATSAAATARAPSGLVSVSLRGAGVLPLARAGRGAVGVAALGPARRRARADAGETTAAGAAAGGDAAGASFRDAPSPFFAPAAASAAGALSVAFVPL